METGDGSCAKKTRLLSPPGYRVKQEVPPEEEVQEEARGGSVLMVVDAAAAARSEVVVRIDIDKDMLHCPLCTFPLKPPIFQVYSTTSFSNFYAASQIHLPDPISPTCSPPATLLRVAVSTSSASTRVDDASALLPGSQAWSRPSLAESASPPPHPSHGMEHDDPAAARAAWLRGLLPTAPMAYAVIADMDAIDSYLPHVNGRLGPPALIPLQMHEADLRDNGVAACEVGHLVCGGCLGQLRANQCHSCNGDGGGGAYTHCPAMDALFAKAMVPCPHQAYGCRASVAYCQAAAHVRAPGAAAAGPQFTCKMWATWGKAAATGKVETLLLEMEVPNAASAGGDAEEAAKFLPVPRDMLRGESREMLLSVRIDRALGLTGSCAAAAAMLHRATLKSGD
ncbi:unnamed protein product [Urochloa decumbens]|uniref:Uncharacterized protein n=1 Tax=Urochloa decumbens TaxID=240449 RepID=A0ABC8YZ44_9POAL